MKDCMTVRIRTPIGKFVEIFIPDEYEKDILENKKYPEFRKLLLELIGAEK